MAPWCILLALGSAAAAPANDSKLDLRCGSYCLYVGLRALDLPVGSFEELEGKLGQPSAAGYSLGQLDEVARGYGAETLGVRTTAENLRRRPGRFVCLAHLDQSHFVNIAAIDGSHALVVDPPRSYRLPLDTLRAKWDGTALLISNKPLLAEEDLPREFPYGIVLFALAGVVAAGSAWYTGRRFWARIAQR